ncbi:MAG: MarR family winged helix-turn-helix transcriptional regulator [Cytophagales bacterium]|nr:MarR family winged helix-turn-helix transcriptional regulator [Cytophagales bacterium]
MKSTVTSQRSVAAATIQAECVASNIGRANRIVSRIFEEAFRDVGVTSAQFALLVELAIRPGSNASQIAERLSSDPSTVSRNTDLLLKRGLIQVQTGMDRRVRTYTLTERGEVAVDACVPRWKYAQRSALKRIGRSNWDQARRWLGRLIPRHHATS